MHIQIIQVPYDSGRRNVRNGRGPSHFVDHGISEAISELGHRVQTEQLEIKTDPMNVVGTTFELNRRLAIRVSAVSKAGRFLLVLAGNCNSCIGTLAGVGSAGLGVIWFDAHADFNTPESTVSGYLDGMGLATVTGHCWNKLAQTVSGFTPVPETNVVLIGARDVDPAEQDRLKRSAIAQISADAIRRTGIEESALPALDLLQQRTRQVYLHIDMDILDMQIARANVFAAPGGLSVQEVIDAIQLIKNRFTIRACALTAYDPAVDPEGRVGAAGLKFAAAVVPDNSVKDK